MLHLCRAQPYDAESTPKPSTAERVERGGAPARGSVGASAAERRLARSDDHALRLFEPAAAGGETSRLLMTWLSALLARSAGRSRPRGCLSSGAPRGRRSPRGGVPLPHPLLMTCTERPCFT
eukprot:gene15890-biopygen12759